jgi:hypothetical protein
MAEPDPHELVVDIAQQFLRRRWESLDLAGKQDLVKTLGRKTDPELQAILRGAVDDAARSRLLQRQIDPFLRAFNSLKSDERTQLATYCDEYVPDVVMLAGFLGGVVEVELGDRTDTWRVLYVDAGLQNWRLIPQDKILAWRTIDDNGVKRSVLWVDANAPTTRGGAPPRPAIQARFLRGDFVRAGDLVAPPGRGGAGGPASGLFCDAITPECCTRH